MILDSPTSLFQPFRLGTCELQNRFVMSAMTRLFANDGVLEDRAVDYYRRRVEGGVGLIISEGAAINGIGAYNALVPHFYGEAALAKWKKIIDAVHVAGGRMMPQLWHAGLIRIRDQSVDQHLPSVGPSTVHPSAGDVTDQTSPPLRALSEVEIEETIQQYVAAAVSAQQLGFDGVEIHGGHGYLVDQFLWEETNKRTDRFGGQSLAERTRFGVDLITEMRAAVGSNFPIGLRFSQWKSPDFYQARLAQTPQELETLLTPLTDAGLSFFDCSTRRFWEAEFPETRSDMNLAGWTKKISGLTTITVGSVGLSDALDVTSHHAYGQDGEARTGSAASGEQFAMLTRMFDRGDFDLVAVGRALIANPDFANKVRSGRLAELKPYCMETLTELV